MNAIFKRVSVRKYLDKEVEDEKIEKILRAAMASPTAMNQQEWEFYIVKDKEKLIELSLVTPYSTFVKDAPCAIVVCSKKETTREEFRDIDCALCTENILLEMTELDLGGCMIGIAPDKEKIDRLNKMINVSEGLDAFTLIPFGYPKFDKEQEDRFDKNKVHFI